MLGKALLSASASAAKVYVEDVFSTYLYTGNNSTQTITNGIDLSGKGGLVWIKGRSGATGHRFTDTARGATKSLESNSTAAEATESTGVTSFSSTGFALGADADYNTNTATYASWTFRKAEKFFDVVTWTGSGANRTISHNLGSVPGAIIVKRTDTTGDWQVYHRSLANTEYLVLNSTAAKATGTTRWNSTTPTSTVFSLGTDVTVNASGGTYVAYLFAHDAGGFGDSGSESVVSCGSYTGTGAAGNNVTLGWEPQWLLIKQSSDTGSWVLIDSMRGFPVGSADAWLYANLTNAESAVTSFAPTATGFVSEGSTLNTSGQTYIYIAIRRGPMKTPTVGTSVFSVKATSGTNTTNFPVDMLIYAIRAGDLQNSFIASRLTGSDGMSTALTDAERAAGWTGWDSNTTRGSVGTNQVEWDFRRAPGFFDVVAYTGDATSTKSIAHNLTVAPELIIIKSRSNVLDWVVGSVYLPNAWNNPFSEILKLNSNVASAQQGYIHSVDSSIFKLASVNLVHGSAYTYIAYLFATCPGVSKVGSYTGTGTTQQINCGFTAGARFVLIKRTDSTGDWYVWDTARGIVSGNDPYLLLNSTGAENPSTDYIDPLSSGFQISSTAPADINAIGGSFIFLAIA